MRQLGSAVRGGGLRAAAEPCSSPCTQPWSPPHPALGGPPLCWSTHGGFLGTEGPSTTPAASWASGAQGGSGMQLLSPPPNVGLNPRLGGAWGQPGPATPLPGAGVALRPPAAVVPGTSDRFYGFWRETAGREAERKQRPPPRPSLQPLCPPHPAPGGPPRPHPEARWGNGAWPPCHGDGGAGGPPHVGMLGGLCPVGIPLQRCCGWGVCQETPLSVGVGGRGMPRGPPVWGCQGL